MKKLTWLFPALLLVQITSSLAHANEERWNEENLVINSTQTRLNGYVTDSGAFRVASIGASSGELQIQFGTFAPSSKVAVKTCEVLGKNVKFRKSSSNTIKIQGYGYPLNENELRRDNVKIENLPFLNMAEVKVTLSEKSASNQASAEKFSQAAKAQILKQIETVRKTGEFSIEVKESEDLACDLVLGNAKVEITFNVLFEDAKPTRDVLLTPDEFTRVYEAARKVSVNTDVVLHKHVMNGAILNSVLAKETNKSLATLDKKGFLPIYNALYKTDSANLKDYQPAQYADVAKSLDLVTYNKGFAGLKTSFTAKAAGL